MKGPFGQQTNVEDILTVGLLSMAVRPCTGCFIYIVCFLCLPRPDQLSVHFDAQLCRLNVSLTRLQGIITIYKRCSSSHYLSPMRISLYDIMLIISFMWSSKASLSRVSVKMEAFKDSCASSTLISVCYIIYIITV